MARTRRRDYVDPSRVQTFHCHQRCVRRAHLCGHESATGKSYEHRRGWIRERLERLASVFGIDCLTYSVMSNHLHLVLRSRPDVVDRWSDEEVAKRWLHLFPKRREADGSPAEPTSAELGMLLNDAKRLAELRRRLSDISWWMRCTSENIARRSNKEDECTGRFWEGRFRCQLLLDEASLLACAAYVDLNPVRAALARTPETCRFTGARDRIEDLLRRAGDEQSLSEHQWERLGQGSHSGWLAPIEIDEREDRLGADVSEGGRRASSKGFLPMSLSDYLQLLDWTGRQLREGKPGAIPESLAPILERVGLKPSGWCQLAGNFGRLFKRAAGTAPHLAEEARRCGQRWLQAPGRDLLSNAA